MLAVGGLNVSENLSGFVGGTIGSCLALAKTKNKNGVDLYLNLLNQATQLALMMKTAAARTGS